LNDNNYIVINTSGYYYIHVYENTKLININININNKKTQLNVMNLLKFDENDILSRHNNDYFNMLICKNESFVHS